MTRRIVVVIEDDPDIAALMTEVLVELGHQVETRADLADGRVELEPRLVITDLVTVRSYDTQDARRWITRVRRVFPNAAVVVSTAHASAAETGAAALGADAVLPKPFEIAAFTETVESLLDR